MRIRNTATLARIAFAGLALLAATASQAAETQTPSYPGQATQLDIDAGNYRLELKPGAERPDYCIEQFALYGYCELAEADVLELYYYKKTFPSRPQSGW